MVHPGPVAARVDVPILTQRDLPKPALIDAFARDEAACLFATAGFFQGVDVPGRTLSQVVIDRLPFPRPDEPLLQARRELARAGAFATVDLPRAATLLAQGVAEHARREKISLATRPVIEFRTDEQLRLGEFGIQARLVKAPERAEEPPSQGDHGHTMVYTVSDRLAEPLREPDPRRGSARLRVGSRTEIVSAQGAVLGRSRDADVVLEDPNVSRRHAELRPSGGSWIVRDLGSTNGVKVNGRRIQGPQSLKSGDTIELGTARVTFELE